MKNAEIERWIQYAKEDLQTAEFLLKNKKPVVHIVFLCHESIEKYLKALIQFQGKEFPYVHHLIKLLSVIEVREEDDVSLSNVCDVLQLLYPQARYPGEVEITHFDAKNAVLKAKIAQKIILKYMV